MLPSASCGVLEVTLEGAGRLPGPVWVSSLCHPRGSLSMDFGVLNCGQALKFLFCCPLSKEKLN
jgi:hypothetical protein